MGFDDFDIYHSDNWFRTVGAGTNSQPLIMWLVKPPKSVPRLVGNEKVATELGQHGYKFVWMRHCDHMTTRVTTRRGGRRTIPADMHSTVYSGNQADLATKQGDLFIFVEANEVWRLMRDHERSTRKGKGVELHPYSG